jgi:hypothetical protein
MSITVPKTLTITIDEQAYEVADLSTEVQQMVQYLDTWRQDEADQTSELLKTRAALRDIQNMILAQIQKEQAEAVTAAESSDESVEAEVIAD